MKKLYGIAPPIITPFKENGEIDVGALKKHCDFLLNAGVHSIYALGTTGEVLLLSHEERKQVAELLVEHVAGRVPVYVQVGAIPTKNACDLAKHAEDIGADGIGAVTPYYFHVDQREMKQYFMDISRSISDDFPMYLYNLPGCTTNDLLPETIGELAEVDNIIGIKNSMGDFSRLMDLLQFSSDRFEILLGNDLLLMSGLISGVKGGVSGNANVFPELFVKLYDATMANDLETARKCQSHIAKVVKVLKDGANFAYFKEALHFRGFKKTYTRKPLPRPDQQEIERLNRELEQITLSMKEL